MTSLSTAQQLLEWIRACNELHQDGCQATPTSTRAREQIPQWVIDTERACIVPGTVAARYVALSYVWPEEQASGDRLILERNNVEALQKPGALASAVVNQLPPVIRQSIDLLKDIRERYLWVDCLCIIQRDSETQSQAYSMNEIYSGAYFTIIAAASEGLTGPERRVRSRSQRLTTAELHYDALMHTKWATRGWTFQEQILSKRAIVFLDPYCETDRTAMLRKRLDGNEAEQPRAEVTKHVFWDCQYAIWDGNKLPAKMKSSPSEIQTLQDGEKGSKVDVSPPKLNNAAWPSFRAYLECVCLYNHRDLTYPQDILAAFAGILNELGHSFIGGFVQGLPHCFIDESLIWQPFSKAVKRQNIVKDGIAPYRYLPSWSWCSWKCAIDPHSLVTGLEYSDDPDPHLRRSWRTKPLNEWSIVSADTSQEVILNEAGMQYKCRKIANRHILPEGDGWTRNYEPTNSGWDAEFFTHTSSGSQRTSFPLPTRGPSRPSVEQLTFPYLSCITQYAYFTVQDFLRCCGGGCYRASLKTSVFDLPQFKESVGQENACSVVALEGTAGEWAGVLRIMDGAEIAPGQELELIALSRGEASYSDVVKFFEERVDFLRMFEYKYGLSWLIWEAQNRNGTRQSSVLLPSHTYVDEEVAQFRPQALVDAFNVSQGLRAPAQASGKYKFYNVMWIEWDAGIAYRRAVGRIMKEAWERYCRVPKKVILG